MKYFTPEHINELMNEVVRVRYRDSKLEKELCFTLLQWGLAEKNGYVEAFAYTYLGDYYIEVSDNEKSIKYLKKARDLSVKFEFTDLLPRIYSLLGFYYNSISDSQSSLEHYIEALTFSHSLHDVSTEASILNNIGYTFQQHKGYQQALDFYKEAYELLQKEKNPSTTLGIVLNNLATISILLKNTEEAKQYILECEKVTTGTDQYDIFRSQNWCQYYIEQKEYDKALKWADYILLKEEELSKNQYDAFDIFSALLNCMIQIKNQDYAQKFLSLSTKYAMTCAFEQQQEIETQRLKFCIAFEHDEEILTDAYKRYAIHTQALETIRNQTITNGLKDAIRFSNAMKQKEQLEYEKTTLAQQVNVDELTKVFTRHYLDQLMSDFEKENYETLGFIMIDVDCLKEYNDTYGHIDGDVALRTVGDLLNKYKLNGFYPCRFGGDEFVCLCINCKDQEIENYIASIRNELYEKHIPHRTSKCADQLTLSIGYCNEAKKISIKEVFELADQALYCSKIQGRNTFSKQSAKQ
ncbi:tetratricopeptide repeat-containing diguanylate cyclase [Amedibacillus sp. YH-ame10]